MERDIEKKLGAKLKAVGCLYVKVSSQFIKGMPDRLVIPFFGAPFFIELKQPGKKPTKIQAARHDDLRNRGVAVFVCATDDDIEKIITYAIRG